MAASNDRNKTSANPSWGDTDPAFPSTEPDNAADVAHDGAGVPVGEGNNKFEVGGRYGDSGPYFGDMSVNDFSKDAAGVPSPDQGEKTMMDMTLEGNKFPRQTGHDSLSEEEAQLT